MTRVSPVAELSMFDGVDLTPTAVANGDSDAATLDERFWAWIRTTPDVVDEFRELALTMKRRGFKRGGAKLICEQIRWQRMIRSGPGGDEFKVNNSYVSRLARHVMAVEPELAGFFELRELRS